MPRASKFGTSSLSFFLPIISIQQRPIPYIVVSTYKLYLLEGASKSDSGMYYYRYGANYPHPLGGYGSGFQKWLWQAEDGNFEPYISCGNGSAMRVGPVGWAFDTIKDVLLYAKCSAECTHNHPEGIKGAQATALCIFLARKVLSKEEIRSEISTRFGYNLNFTCNEIRDTYKGGGNCQDTVPQVEFHDIGEKLISNKVLTKALLTLKIITIFAFNNELKFRK